MEFRRVLFRSPAAPALGALAAARAGAADGAADRLRGLRPVAAQPQRAGDLRRSRRALQVRLDPRRDGIRPAVLDLAGAAEIGRASCRERVCQYVSIAVVAVSLKNKKRAND